MAYEGEAPLRFQVEVTQNGAAFRRLVLDPTAKNISIGEVKTSFNDRVSWRFAGKNTELEIPADGRYTFWARLVAAPNPTLKIAKAELVLKQ